VSKEVKEQSMEKSSKKDSIEFLAEKAKDGDKWALEEIVREIKDKIYGLALRMLYFPEDAEDATQEILIRIITHLDSFEGRSRFSTWAFRIASNHLLTTRRRRAEKIFTNIDDYEQVISTGTSRTGGGNYNAAELKIMANEVKLICIQGMLLTLKREIRLAFIMGEVFGASSDEGAEALGITPESFRQRLSRGRRKIREFMVNNCSLINPDNPCYCEREIDNLRKVKLLDPKNPMFLNHPCKTDRQDKKEDTGKELDELARVTALFRSHPDYSAPDAFIDIVKELVESGKFQLLNAH
jgi:RNA polymerase sigma factor (sigma-70 family)